MAEALGYGRISLIKKIIEQNYKNLPETIKFTFNDVLFVIQEMLHEEGKKYFDDRMSRRGHNVFREFVKVLLHRNLANYDSMVLLTSEKGTGKSSSAIMMAREWARLIGIKFDPQRHIAYSNAEIIRKIDLLNKFEPLILDESVRFASAADWAKCIDGESVISTPNGNIKIKDLEGKKDFLVYCYNEEKEQIEIQKAEICLKIKEDIVYEIETEDGKKIKATKEHKFLTNEGWKMLEELKNGETLINI